MAARDEEALNTIWIEALILLIGQCLCVGIPCLVAFILGFTQSAGTHLRFEQFRSVLLVIVVAVECYMIWKYPSHFTIANKADALLNFVVGERA
uniref:Transmembrane protein n=1 Tax=Rhabditophanes sp. KR3021 TaxID=114890 RepID=A0AC35TV40_9BILA